MGEQLYPLENQSLEAYRWPRVEDFDFSNLRAELQSIRDQDRTAASGHCGVGWLHHVQMRSYNHSPFDVLDDVWMEEYIGRCREFASPILKPFLPMQAGW